MAEKEQYDLKERLLEYAAGMVRFAEALSRTAATATRHVSGQLQHRVFLRCSMLNVRC